jgi:hypothetical protein
MRNETAASSANLHGDKLYQQRAREALPILVRQAFGCEPIFYQELADEMGMPNPRNLNFVLGSVGQSLIELGTRWGEAIPPIQCLVINQKDELPGQGFGWFMSESADWRGLTKRQKATLTQAVMQQIYAYPKWGRVLHAFELTPAKYNYAEVVGLASGRYGGGGESEDHWRLKDYVRHRPSIVGLARRFGPGIVEKGIPSGDRLDVFFDAGDEWVGVEVKSARSDEVDLVRGLFQCVKYKAVLNAMLVSEQRDANARAVLVLEGILPTRLIPLKHMLGVEVVESVVPGAPCSG